MEDQGFNPLLGQLLKQVDVVRASLPNTQQQVRSSVRVLDDDHYEGLACVTVGEAGG